MDYTVRTMQEQIANAVFIPNADLFIEMVQHLMNANLVINGSIAFPLPIAKLFNQNWDQTWHGIRGQDKLVLIKEEILFPNKMCEWNYNVNVSLITLILQMGKKHRVKAMDFLLSNHLFNPNTMSDVMLHEYKSKKNIYKMTRLYPVQEALFAADLHILEGLINEGANLNLLPQFPVEEGSRALSYTSPLFYLNEFWFRTEHQDDFKAALDLFAKAGVDFNPKECFQLFIGPGGTYRPKVGVLNMMCAPKEERWRSLVLEDQKGNHSMSILLQKLLHNGLTEFSFYSGRQLCISELIYRLSASEEQRAETSVYVQTMCEMGLTQQYQPQIKRFKKGAYGNRHMGRYQTNETSQIVAAFSKRPLTMQQVGRVAVRRAVGGVRFADGVDTLPLPKAMKEYILAV